MILDHLESIVVMEDFPLSAPLLQKASKKDRSGKVSQRVKGGIPRYCDQCLCGQERHPRKRSCLGR